MSKTSFSKEKLESKILSSLNTFIRTGLGDPQFRFLTITKVELGGENSYVNLFWDCFDPDSKEKLKVKVPKLEGKFRKNLASMLNTRNTPEVRIFVDESFESQQKIDELLNK